MSPEEAVSLLKTEIGFVVFGFSDSSKLVVCTTLNTGILDALKALHIEDCFYDLKRKKYIGFRYDAASVEVYREEPVLSEVDSFANRFI